MISFLFFAKHLLSSSLTLGFAVVVEVVVDLVVEVDVRGVVLVVVVVLLEVSLVPGDRNREIGLNEIIFWENLF